MLLISGSQDPFFAHDVDSVVNILESSNSAISDCGNGTGNEVFSSDPSHVRAVLGATGGGDGDDEVVHSDAIDVESCPSTSFV